MFIKKISSHILLSFLILLFPLSAFAANSEKGATKGEKASAADSKKVYTGDPATKRGYELGYDYGVKAGKEDKKNGKKESPSNNDEYKTAEKYFRSEYGNRGRFVSGYQSGFLKGYKSGFNREKTDPEAAKNAKNKDKTQDKNASPETKSKKSSSETLNKEPSKASDSVKTVRPKPRAPTAADDAL